MTTDRFEARRPSDAPVLVVPAPRAHDEVDAGARRPRPLPSVRHRRAWLLVAVNVVGAYVVLAVVLPAPWGILVPIVALAQVAIVRRGAMAALAVAMLGCAAGGALAALRAARGAPGDPVRMVCAVVLVCMTALAAWPGDR